MAGGLLVGNSDVRAANQQAIDQTLTWQESSPAQLIFLNPSRLVVLNGTLPLRGWLRRTGNHSPAQNTSAVQAKVPPDSLSGLV